MRESSRYCTITGLIALLGLVAAVAFNALIDPFGMYRAIDLHGINSLKPAIYQRVRLAKAYEIRRIEPRAIVLGTSRSHIGLRLTHPGWTALPRYNLSFDGATTREMYAYLVHAQSLQALKQVVLGLDTWQLSNAPSGVRPGFDPSALLTSPGWFPRLQLAATDLRILASLDTLTASLQTLREQDSGDPEWLASDGQRLGEVYFRRAGELFHEQSPRVYFDAYDREEIGWRRPPPVKATVGATSPPDPTDSSLQWIFHIVAFCRAHAIDLRIYITPAHAHQLEMAIAADEWQQLESAKREIVSYLTDEAARHANQQPIPLWDFSGYSSVTTESLTSTSSHGEMRYYWDSSHFKESVGDWVLDRVLGTARDGQPPPPDFGVQLDAANVDAALRAIRIKRAEYARVHQTEVMEIEALIGQVLGRQAPRHHPVLAKSPLKAQ